jgi:hemerythrin superfamily protein
MSSDAIVILKADHKEIRNLFRKLQAAGDKAVKTKETILGQIIELLTVHTYIENEVMYPEVCALLPHSRTMCWSPAKNITWPTSCAWS